MKSLVLVLSLMLTACFSTSMNCTKLEYRPFKFNDRVSIVSGFYEGQLGRIVSQSWIYNSNACNSLAFKIRLDNLDELVNIDQDNIAKAK